MRTPFSPARGFTLVELLVATSILALLLVVLASITSQASRTWQYTTGKVEEFREARGAFETMTRRVGQATLNTYWDYQYNASGAPIAYVRQSELRFVTGSLQHATGSTDTGAVPPLLPGTDPVRPTHGIFFQAPLGYTAPKGANDPNYNEVHGLDNLLNTWGYYLEVNDDVSSGQRPSILDNKTPPLRVRSRLMELMEPSDELSIYQYTLPGVANPALAQPTNFGWFSNTIANAQQPPASGGMVAGVHVLAENIIALIMLPKLSKQDQAALTTSPQDYDLCPDYYYNSGSSGQAASSPLLNSKNQLPPVVQVTMVALDDLSARRFADASGAATGSTQSVSAAMTTALQLDQRFEDASKYAADLLANPPAPATADPNCLEKLLIKNKLNYRIFTTNVTIRGAKWSQAQTK